MSATVLFSPMAYSRYEASQTLPAKFSRMLKKTGLAEKVKGKTPGAAHNHPRGRAKSSREDDAAFRKDGPGRMSWAPRCFLECRTKRIGSGVCYRIARANEGRKEPSAHRGSR